MNLSFGGYKVKKAKLWRLVDEVKQFYRTHHPVISLIQRTYENKKNIVDLFNAYKTLRKQFKKPVEHTYFDIHLDIYELDSTHYLVQIIEKTPLFIKFLEKKQGSIESRLFYRTQTEMPVNLHDPIPSEILSVCANKLKESVPFFRIRILSYHDINTICMNHFLQRKKTLSLSTSAI